MTPFDPHAYLDAASAALELPIPPQHRDGVAANLARLQQMARDVIDFPLPEEDEDDAPRSPAQLS